MRASFTTRRLFELVLVLGLLAMAARGVGDPDFWWHLRTGQYIFSSHSIPHSDLFSHTRHGAPWIAHEWLSELAIFLIFRWAGYLGLVVSFAAIICASFWLAFRRGAGRPYIAGVVMLWGAIATIPFWGVRPQMFSLLLTSIFLYLLDRFDRTGRVSYLWWMPLLTAIWVNLHGAFAVGLALIASAVACRLIDALIDPTERNDKSSGTLALVAVFLVSVFAVVLNPNGYRMYLYPFETLASPSIQAYIAEWASPNFHAPGMQAFALLLIGTFVAVVISGKRPATRDFVLFIVVGYAALRSSRHIPLFTLVAVPVLCSALESILVERNWLAGLRMPEVRNNRTALNYTIACLLVVACSFRVMSVLRTQGVVESHEMPKAAVEYIRHQRPAGPIFNSYEWGGYLVWNLYPDYPVYVDGRCDMYGDEFLNEFVRTYRAENDWNTVLGKTGVQTAILPPDSPLAHALSNDANWNTAFRDSVALVFVRRNSTFSPLAGLATRDSN